jgi:hypothetical protein
MIASRRHQHIRTKAKAFEEIPDQSINVASRVEEQPNDPSLKE